MEQIKIIFVYNLFVLLMYFLGSILVNNFTQKKEIYTNIFFSLLTGWICVILAGSLAFSHFKTIHIGWLLLILIALIKKRFNIQFSWKIRPTEILMVSLFSNSILLYAFYINYGFDLNYFQTPFKDFVFYANMSRSIVESGYENYNIFNELIPLKGATPYHYSEIWFNGIVSYLSKLPNVKVMVLITYPIGRLIAFFGIWAILNKIYTSRFNFLVAFMFLHFCGICKNELGFSHWIENLGIFYYDVFYFMKLFPITLFFIAALLTYLEFGKVTFKTFLFLSFIAFSYFLAIIGIGILLSLLLLEKMIREKKPDYYSIALVTCFLYIPLFYFLYRVPMANNLSLDLEYLTSLQFLKFCIGEIISVTLRNFVNYILFIPLLFFIPYKKPYIYIICLSILGCIISSSILRYTDDHFQIVTNYGVPLLNLVIFVFAFYVSRNSSNQILRYYITGVLIFHFLLKIYDFNSYKEMVSRQQIVYEQKVTETMQNKVKMAAIFLHLPDSSHQSKKTYVTFPASFIFNTYPDYMPVNLSVLDWPLITTLDSIVVQSSVFYQFHIKHPELSNEDLKLKFIRDYDIRTIILDNYAEEDLPETLRKIEYKKYSYKNESVLFFEKQIPSEK